MSATLSAVLIVRDEAPVIAECLASLTSVVDDIYVHDTGSTDDTIEIAKRFGAHVSEGPWTDDFAAARNEALNYAHSDWVLSIDADETVVVDSSMLRVALLNANFDVAQVTIEVEHNEAPYVFPAARVFRPAAVRWHGSVHEQLVNRNHKPVESEALPAEIVRIVHSGYATEAQRRLRAARNEVLAVTAQHSDDDQIRSRALVDLGRSLVSSGKNQEAANAFESVRSQFPNSPEWTEATDFLTRLVLAEEMYAETLVLTRELHDNGARSDYCDWLAAQALIGLGNYDEAKALLTGVTEVVDTSGRVHSSASLDELKAIVNQLAG